MVTLCYWPRLSPRMVAKPLATLVFLLSSCVVAFGVGANYTTCLQNVETQVNVSLHTGIWNSGSLGTVDTQGRPTTDTNQITGLTYKSCVDNCGSAPVDFNWPTFSQEFTSWLLPWLALISQLPYGTRDTLSNFLAVLLTVGSPTLAAYSLALAVISNRWMVKRFGRSTYHNTWLAAQTLSSLQQVSLELPPEEHVLPSLIVLPENGIWWQKLAHGLDYPVPKWTLAAIMSVLYVALADSFTWINTLSGPLPTVVVNATGESISSLWLCFLPIVIGNLQLSPKSDWDRIRRAFSQANLSFYVATEDGFPEPGRGSLLINIRTASWDAIDEDELCSAPVFFYARAFSWIRLAGKVTDGFDAASRHERDHHTSDASPSKRQHVIDYCKNEDQTNEHRYEIYSIFLRSAFLAIFLQWGTTGAAIMAMFFTPTKGLGCRSGTYLLYGIISTVIWFLCVLSSFLAHSYKSSPKGTTTSQFVWVVSIGCRLTAKTLAAFNAVLLFLAAVLQFSNLIDNCYCNSSKLGLRGAAYTVITYTSDFLYDIKIAWAGGLIMSLLTASLFLLAINLLRKRPAGPGILLPDSWELSELNERNCHRRGTLSMTKVAEDDGCTVQSMMRPEHRSTGDSQK